MTSALSPMQRRRDIDRLRSETFDVLVIGGGITGTGAALDAASRGLSVGLIEQRDLASGTSSRSSKLIHGGLRYLEQLNFRLVWEALHERGLLLDRIAPHLVRPVSFLYPLTHRVWERLYVGAGVTMYDLFARAGVNPLPWHRQLSRRRAIELFPSLRKDGLVGAIRYWDAQEDDARFVLTVARTAAGLGAAIAPSMIATGLRRDGDRVTGVETRCLECGETFTINARTVINATGVWTDKIQDFAGRGAIHVRASKGIHLVVPRDRIRGDTGLITKTEKSVLFVIPWDRHWIIGTTDTDWDLDLAHPAASSTDIEYLLKHINKVIDPPLGHDDVAGVFAGLRPLLYGESDSTSKLTREHAVTEVVPGLITVAGGKYTTYRVMAKDAVDATVKSLGSDTPPSATHDLALAGAEGYRDLWDRREQIAVRRSLSLETVEHLLHRYGSMIEDIFGLIDADPTLGRTLSGGYLRAEIVYAASHEGALHLDDVLTRRTRISVETADRGTDVAEEAARLIGPLLGWDEQTRRREVTYYLARVEAERDSQRQPDDRTADAVRLGAPDIRKST
ncbi:MAG: glycerol-3-phosphate dehydrogenase/oxidase [Actinobacteria bacterium]|nr:glycerol-3-phosphate dehydrogenase/oxidase [Actinomycetota bacterium]